MKANTIIARITRAVESLRAACAAPVAPACRGNASAEAKGLLVPIHGNPDAPILVTSTMTGSFTVIDCAMTGRRS